jgi:hypothetical protein
LVRCRKLLRRPRPYPDESLAGYIIRLTQANYYSSPKWIFQISGLRARGIYANVFNREKDDLSRLSNISDVEAGILWSMAFPANTFSYPKVVKQVKVFDHVVPTDALNRQQIKLCPICLQEKLYYRFFWELSVVSACALHHCLLIDRCPQCQEPIHWSRPKIAICSCQFDWRSFQPQALESEHITLSSLIYKLCHLGGSPLENNLIVSSDNPVTQLNLGSLVNLLVSLLRFCRLPGIRYQVFPPKQASLGFSFQSLSEFERVFALLKNWPDNFCQLMDRYEVYLGYGTSSRYVSGLLFRDIVNFFQSVFIWFSQESWGFLSTIFTAYFERFLEKLSIKNIQISFYRDFRFCSVCISLTRKAPLTEKLASRSELEGLTLAKLFATSRIDWYNDTLFFRMRYFPD